MILASFDLSFFTSIPGMLITGGVLLLLIALIIFIATGSKKGNKKNKKEKDNVASVDATAPTDTANATAMDASVNTMDVPTTSMGNAAQVNNVVADTVSSTPTVEPSVVSPEVNNNPVNVGEVQPSTDANTNQSAMPAVDMPTNNVVTPSVTPDTTPVVGDMNASVNNVVTPENVVTPVENNINDVNMNNNIDTATPSDVASAPAVTIVDDNNSNNDIPAVEAAPKEEPKPIYGGSSPVIPKIEIDNNVHRPIYGGANPLENTQSIPIVNNVASTPTVEPTSDVKVDIPTVTATPNVVSPSEVVTNENNNTVVSTPSIEMPVKEEPVINVNPAPTNEVSSHEPKKEEEIESLF